MRKIRELLRLKFGLELSDRKIAQSLSIARSSIKECLNRVTAAQLSWPLPDELDDVALEAMLYRSQPTTKGTEVNGTYLVLFPRRN